jgi:hypothetical protein
MGKTKSKSISDLTWDQKVKIKNHLKNKKDNSINCIISDLRIMNSYARVTFKPKFAESDNIKIDLNLDSATNLSDKETEFARFVKNQGILPSENNITSKLVGRETELEFQIKSNSVEIINPYSKEYKKENENIILRDIKSNLPIMLVSATVLCGSLVLLYIFELIVLNSLYVGLVAYLICYFTIAELHYSNLFVTNKN